MGNWVVYSDTLVHHGILGQKWGIRRYQNEDGTLTPAGKKRYYDKYGNLTKKGRNEYGGEEFSKSFASKKKEIDDNTKTLRVEKSTLDHNESRALKRSKYDPKNNTLETVLIGADGKKAGISVTGSMKYNEASDKLIPVHKPSKDEMAYFIKKTNEYIRNGLKDDLHSCIPKESELYRKNKNSFNVLNVNFNLREPNKVNVDYGIAYDDWQREDKTAYFDIDIHDQKKIKYYSTW